MLYMFMYFTPPQLLSKQIAEFFFRIFKNKVEYGVDPNQLASQKSADLDLHRF